MPSPIRAARRLAAGSLLALAVIQPAGAGEAGARHAAWGACLARAFGAPLTGRAQAADAALRACRAAEDAYVAALAASPLLDPADIAGARPAIVARARARLLGPAALPRTAER